MNIEEAYNTIKKSVEAINTRPYATKAEYEKVECIKVLLTAYEKEEEKNKKINKYIEDRAKIGKDIQTFINKDYVEQEYISKEEAEQKERKAYIKGTNDADELCNKKWKDKINAEISLLEIEKQEVKKAYPHTYAMCDEYRNVDAQIEFGELLLKEE